MTAVFETFYTGNWSDQKRVQYGTAPYGQTSKEKKHINISLQCEVGDNRNRVICGHKTGVFQPSLEGSQKASRGSEGFHCVSSKVRVRTGLITFSEKQSLSCSLRGEHSRVRMCCTAGPPPSHRSAALSVLLGLPLRGDRPFIFWKALGVPFPPNC